MSSPNKDSNSRASELLLALTPGIGPRLRKMLLEHFGSAPAVIAAAPSELRKVRGIGPKLCQNIIEARSSVDVQAELAKCEKHGITLLAEWDSGYPEPLRKIPDPPGVL